MLNTMRGAVSGWTAKILLGLLVISFAVWGIGDVFRGGTVDSVLTAGDTSVSLQEYALAYNRTEAQVARQLGRRPTAEEMQMFGADQGVVSQLAAGAVLEDQGRRIGLGLSEQRLAQVIAEDPSFQDASGRFSRSTFENLLANARISQVDYIRSQEKQAVRSQIIDAVSSGVTAPKVLDRAMGLYNGERRTVDYVELTSSSIDPTADPSDDVLKEYFEANKATYAAPEYRAISYAVVSPETLADPSTVTEEQIQADYDRYKERYSTPERRRVEQIVFADKAAAEAAKEKLSGGATFEDVAKDAGKSLSDIDLGTVARSQIPDGAIAEAAFALESGQTSDVVDGTFGPAIVKVTSIEPGSVKPVAEVADEIRKQVALVSANDTAATAYNSFEDARGSGASFQEAAEGAGLSIKKVDAVDQSGNGPEGKPIDLPAKQEFLSDAFETEPGFDNVPVNYGSNAYVFYNVDSVDPARDRTLDEVKAKVVADWKAEEMRKRLSDKASFLASEIRAGNKTLDQVATELSAQKRTAQAITRQTGAAELGQAGVAAAFSGGDGTVAAAPGRSGESQIVLKVMEVSEPADPTANVAANERQQMDNAFQDDLLQSYVTLLQNETPLSIHPAGIERAKAMVR